MRNIFVFFDLGGTLVDLRGIVASMAARLSAIRVRGPVPLALRWAVATAEALPVAQGPRFRSEREIASDVLFDLLAKRSRADARDASVRLVREAWSGYVGSCNLQPDITIAWLRALQSKVSGLGVVTDGDTDAVADVLSHTGLTEIFDTVTTSEAVRSYKPDPGIYRSAMKALKARPSESLFVSDAALDLQGAANLGIAAAWIRRNLLPDLTKPPPSTVVLSRIQDVDRMVGSFAKTGRFALR
ncbi:MAG TPA: HAD family hydrolase [Thermoplasmata archaeon]|nr:HAD family hydrolase [Thermoplasmata archaeon]